MVGGRAELTACSAGQGVMRAATFPPWTACLHGGSHPRWTDQLTGSAMFTTNPYATLSHKAEEHVRGYLSEVMLYFWAGRAEAYASGVVPPLGALRCPRHAACTGLVDALPLKLGASACAWPAAQALVIICTRSLCALHPTLLCSLLCLPAADLDGYLAIERRRPACGDPQHIFNKLLFDAANEALLSHYNQVGWQGVGLACLPSFLRSCLPVHPPGCMPDCPQQVLPVRGSCAR